MSVTRSITSDALQVTDSGALQTLRAFADWTWSGSRIRQLSAAQKRALAAEIGDPVNTTLGVGWAITGVDAGTTAVLDAYLAVRVAGNESYIAPIPSLIGRSAAAAVYGFSAVELPLWPPSMDLILEVRAGGTATKKFSFTWAVSLPSTGSP